MANVHELRDILLEAMAMIECITTTSADPDKVSELNRRAYSILAQQAEPATAQIERELPAPDITTKRGYPAYSVELVSRMLGARPAQTEQPVAMQPDCDAVAVCGCRIVQSRKLGNVVILCATHIAQTAPQVPPRMEMEPYQTVDRRSTNYKAGWNACRKAMLEGQTAPQPVVDANFIGDAADSLISVITEKGVHLNVREATQIIGEALVGLSTQRGEA